MAYYTNTFAGQAGLSLAAAHMNDQFEAIAAGFDALDAAVARSIRAPGVEALSVLPVAATRATKYLQFDKDGDALGFVTPVKAHSGASNNPASIKKTADIASGDKWYPIIGLKGGAAIGGGDTTVSSFIVKSAGSGSVDSGTDYYVFDDNEDKITVVKAGTYRIYATAYVSNLATGIEITLNGSAFARPMVSENPQGVTSNQGKNLILTGTVALSASDVLRGRLKTSVTATLVLFSLFVMKIA